MPRRFAFLLVLSILVLAPILALAVTLTDDEQA